MTGQCDHQLQTSKKVKLSGKKRVSEQDFVVQRQCFYLLHDWLEDQVLKQHDQDLKDRVQAEQDSHADG